MGDWYIADGRRSPHFAPPKSSFRESPTCPAHGCFGRLEVRKDKGTIIEVRCADCKRVWTLSLLEKMGITIV